MLNLKTPILTLNIKNLYHVYIERDTEEDTNTLYDEVVYSENFDDLKSYFKNNFKNCYIEISHMRVDELPFYSEYLDKL